MFVLEYSDVRKRGKERNRVIRAATARTGERRRRRGHHREEGKVGGAEGAWGDGRWKMEQCK